MRKLPDIVACRRLIQRTREGARKAMYFIKQKHLSIKFDEENGNGISTLTTIKYHKITGNVGLTCGLIFNRARIFPGKNQKQNCKTEWGKHILQRQRANSNRGASRYKAFYSTVRIVVENNYAVSDFLSVHANPDNKIIISHAIEYKRTRFAV